MRVRSSLSGTGLSVMELATLSNLDYLAARLHGRRSQLAEKGRLAALGELGSFAELTQAMQSDAYLALAGRSLEEKVRQPLKARGLPITV